MTVTERITALRKQMKEKGIDAYLVPTDDFTVPSMWEIILNAGNILPDLPVLPELLSSCRIWRDSGQTEDILSRPHSS